MSDEAKKPENPHEKDETLVRACQGGSREAFDKLVLRHKNRIFSLCFWLLGDYEEANDSAQEIFIKVYRSLSRFRFEAAFGTWLYRIAVNTCKNRRKSSEYRSKRRTVSLQNPGPGGSPESVTELSDDSPSPLNGLVQQERGRAIRKAVDALPPDQKEVIALRDIQGLSYEEIVQITGLNLGTVKSRIARARLDLREKLWSLL